MPTEVGGTEVKVPKAGSYLEGKPKGDNSMTLKVWPQKYFCHEARQLRCIWLKLNCLNPSPCSMELGSAVMRLTKDLLHSDAQ